MARDRVRPRGAKSPGGEHAGTVGRTDGGVTRGPVAVDQIADLVLEGELELRPDE